MVNGTIEFNQIDFDKREARITIDNDSILVEFDFWGILRASKWHQKSRWTLAPSDGYRDFKLSDVYTFAIIAALKAVHTEREANRTKALPTPQDQIDAAIRSDRRQREFERESQERTDAALRKLEQRKFEIEVENHELPNPWE
jgi:hypothetical protein